MIRKLWIGVAMMSGLSITLLCQSPLETYQRALVQEQAAGNLEEAITLYHRAVTAAGPDRSLAAKALIRAAGAEEKLRDPRAAESYRQVLSAYAEQKEEVAIAQARLAALRLATPAARQASSAGVHAGTPTVASRTFTTYCVTCHNETRNVANLNLEALRSINITEHTTVWENLLRRLRARRDPPFGQPRPAEGTYLTLISSLEVALDQAYPVNATLSAAERVTGEELANRMAAFIWGPDSKPDTALSDAAQRGRLRDSAELERQVRRMLRDPKSSALAANFLERWILFDGVKHLTGDRRPPALDDALLAAFQNETRLFLESQIRDDRSAMELWTANYSFVNERLARHYGISGVSGEDFRRVPLPGKERAGILGHGSFLTVTSMGVRTSPSVRGEMILRLLTGTNPPDPPPNIPALGNSPAQADRPMRERLAQHVVNPVCATCHRVFDPLGFSLENFDPVGSFRQTQSGVFLDVSGEFADGTKFSGPVEFRDLLPKYRDAYNHNIAQKMLGFALGRQALAWKVYDHEMPTVRAIVREAAANDSRWSSIVLGIVKSTPFQMRNIVP